jgi:hypothetical protein
MLPVGPPAIALTETKDPTMHTAAVHDVETHDLETTDESPDFAALFPPSDRDARLTARTAALLHEVLRYLGDVGRARLAALGDRAVCEGDDDLFTALPEFTWQQRQPWRRRFVAGFDRLAARLAEGRAPLPSTPAEEFALWLAIVQAALLIAVEPELVLRTVDDTPPDEADFDWQWCHARLFRHGYIPLLCQTEFEGLQHPGHEANRRLRIGDYRPGSWFLGFDEPAAVSSGNR